MIRMTFSYSPCMKLKENGAKMTEIICGKCRQEMQEVELEQYEFEEGIVLEKVKAMRCPNGHITFTEQQASDMEQRSEDTEKCKIEMIPLGKKRFMVELK